MKCLTIKELNKFLIGVYEKEYPGSRKFFLDILLKPDEAEFSHWNRYYLSERKRKLLSIRLGLLGIDGLSSEERECWEWMIVNKTDNYINITNAALRRLTNKFKNNYMT